MNIFGVRELPYDGSNLKFLGLVDQKDNLYRASEKSEFGRVMRYGTNRGGFKNDKMWENTNIPYEDVIFATTAEDIIEAEKEESRSSSFKKFKIYKTPMLLIYDIKGFEKIGDRQWRFKDPANKKKYLKYIVHLKIKK